MSNASIAFKLPKQVQELWNAQQALKDRYSKTGLKFTLDGRLVGDIAEAIVFEKFDLVWPEGRMPGVDFIVRNSKKTVQVKASGLPGGGPSFSPGEGKADYLMFFQLDFKNGSTRVLYNGPEDQVRKYLTGKFNSTKTVKLEIIKAEAEQIPRWRSVPSRSLPGNRGRSQ